MILPQRLLKVAGFIEKGAAVADIGTDHGLLPVYLALHSLARRIIASDVSAGSLSAAIRSAQLYGVCEQISFVNAPGLTGLSKNDADTIIIAGLGGETIMGILDEAPRLNRHNIKYILQPQSKINLLCNWLHDNGYVIHDAALALDRGKYYCVLLVKWRKWRCAETAIDGNNETPVSEYAIGETTAGSVIDGVACHNNREAELYLLLIRKHDPLVSSFLDDLILKANRTLESIGDSDNTGYIEMKNRVRILTQLKEER